MWYNPIGVGGFMLKSSDITIITSDIPPEIVKKPNKETTDLISFILTSDYFNSFVKYFLEENSTPTLSIRDLIAQLNAKFNHNAQLTEETNKVGFEYYLNIKNALYTPFEKDFCEFTALLSLPDSFAWDIFLLIQFHSFREIYKEDYPSILYLPTPSDISEGIKSLGDYGVASALWFDHQVSKQELLIWLDNNWENIENEMIEYLPQSPIKTTNFNDLELTNEMYVLYKKGKTPTQVLRILSKKYENNLEIYDKLSLEFVKNKISRFKKLLSREMSPREGMVIKKEDSITIFGFD